ncbi:peptide chain release factor N(5)-glutamine methyltransferase [Candidatus Parcubacteria bacterium]|nr:peptide chain release factor N(5)-glutamine methyltransferase [Candidatus Parcubacteria bacterium]
MTIAQWLFDVMQKLGEAGVDSPRRDALVLLEDTLNKDRAWIITHPEYEIPGHQLHEINQLVKRRIDREPLAYIRNKAWFYKRFFNVTPDVMIPRPESESFINLIKQITNDNVKGLTFHIVDVGTGSGCLAITAKLELPSREKFPGCEVIAIENSEKALKVAKKNAEKHQVHIQFLKGNLLEPLLNTNYELRNTILMANLPYVPDGLVTSPEIKQEPAEALFSGKDGLDHYRKFFTQIATMSQIDNRSIGLEYVLTESLKTQHAEMIKLAKKTGYKLIKTDVLIQIFRK